MEELFRWLKQHRAGEALAGCGLIGLFAWVAGSVILGARGAYPEGASWGQALGAALLSGYFALRLRGGLGLLLAIGCASVLGALSWLFIYYAGITVLLNGAVDRVLGVSDANFALSYMLTYGALGLLPSIAIDEFAGLGAEERDEPG